MTLEEWKIIIDSSSSLWIAGMATIQASAVVVTLFFAYKQYESFIKKKIRKHAFKIEVANKKLTTLQKNIMDFSVLEQKIEIDQELNGRFSDELLIIYHRVQNLMAKFEKHGNDIKNLNQKIESNLLVLSDENLDELHLKRSLAFNELESNSIRVKVALDAIFYSKEISENRKMQMVNSVYRIYESVKKSFGNITNTIIIPSGEIIEKESYGILKINADIEKAISEYLR